MEAKDIIKAAISDFEGFYINNLKVKIEWNTDTALLIRGDGKNARILIPKIFMSMPVDKDEDKVYTLFIIGHELAHYINKHNYHDDQSDDDSSALEMWADFFGTIIGMSILLLGKKTHTLFHNDMIQDGDKAMELILLSLDRLYEIFQSNDGTKKYEHSSSRLHTISSGITSFLVRHDMSIIKEDDPKDPADKYLKSSQDWGIVLVKSLKPGSSLERASEELKLQTKSDLIDLAKRATHMKILHVKLMNGKSEITTGINPCLQWILGTDFNRPDIEHKGLAFAFSLFEN